MKTDYLQEGAILMNKYWIALIFLAVVLAGAYAYQSGIKKTEKTQSGETQQK